MTINLISSTIPFQRSSKITQQQQPHSYSFSEVFRNTPREHGHRSRKVEQGIHTSVALEAAKENGFVSTFANQHRVFESSRNNAPKKETTQEGPLYPKKELKPSKQPYVSEEHKARTRLAQGYAAEDDCFFPMDEHLKKAGL